MSESNEIPNVAQHSGQKIAKISQEIFGKPLRDPILGRHFKLPDRGPIEETVKLDTSLSAIPVYAHLKIYDVEILKRPPTPPAIKRIENEDYMDFHMSPKTLPKVSNTSSLKVSPAIVAAKEGRDKKLDVPSKHF